MQCGKQTMRSHRVSLAENGKFEITHHTTRWILGVHVEIRARDVMNIQTKC
jgi:hypothetical protein